MKKNFLNLLTILAVCAAVLLLAETGYSQRRIARGKVYTKAEVEQVVNRLEERVDNFVKHYDKSLDRSRLDGTEREDWLMRRARDLESATDELRREFDRRDTWAENKAEVRRCLNVAEDINKNMKARRYSADTEAIWARVRYELNTLARIYNLPLV
jgi:sugar-specific transcriptional regulator TrmB